MSRRSASSSAISLLTFSPSHALSFSFSHLGITNLRFINPFTSTISRFTLAPAFSLPTLFSFLPPLRRWGPDGAIRSADFRCRYRVDLFGSAWDKLLMQVCLLRTIGALQPSKNLVQRIMYLYLVRIFCDSIRPIRSERIVKLYNF